jgi:CDP-diacylglycerol--serine O-phosphatidyltransferase
VFIAIAVNLGLLAWLQTKFFALFFVFYVCVTLLLNIGWQQGWRGVAPPEVYED